MCAPISPSQTRTVLLNLREYISLLQTNRSLTNQGEEPPPEIHNRLEQLRDNLPCQVMDYINLLIRKSSHRPEKAITSLTGKGSCKHCRSSVHPEWIELVARGEIIYLCGGCGAVFVPNVQEQKVIS